MSCIHGRIMYSSFEPDLGDSQRLTEVYLLSKLNRDRSYFENCIFFHKTPMVKSDYLIPFAGFFTKIRMLSNLKCLPIF